MSEKNSAITLLEKEMVYNVGEEEVKLTGNIVKSYLARGNKQINNREIVVFMNLCKYRKLNPFLNEAYLVKFGEDAQIVTGKEAFMRKAEENPRYKGHRAGIIVVRDKEVVELEGCFKLPTDTLVGGWSEVFVKDKEYPIVAKVSLSEYSKNQSTWKSMPATMIRKVALVQALREAFPGDIGALYSQEEVGQETPKRVVIQEEINEEIKVEANKEVIDIEEPINKEPAQTKQDDVPTVEAEIIKEDEEEGDAPY
ncbi:phage recombination protein Bet [Clostridium sp. DL1XJH146]